MEEENNEVVKIKKLQNVSDWSRWKFQLKVLLNDLDIYGIVTGDDLMPVNQIVGTETQAEAAGRYSTNYKAWKKKDNKVQKYLSTTVGDQALLHIMNYNTAKEMWDKLHAVFEQKSQTSIHLIQQKYYAYQMDENDNIASHISKLEDLAQQLKDLGEPIPKSMLMTKILMTLPSSFSHFHVAWESTATSERTLENLTSRLMVEEARLAAFEEQLNSTAFAARSQSKRTNYKSSHQNVKPGKCFKCDSSGHWRRDCPLWKRDAGSNMKRDSESNVRKDIGAKQKHDTGDALVSEAFIGEMAFYAAKNESDKWYMDSGASDHMSNMRQWFSNYVKLQSDIPIRIGDGKFIYAIGRGEINIEAFDGNIWVKKQLLNVLYVPDIKLQLFSFGTALDKNLTFTADRYNCYFRSGDITVAVGERKNKLFEMRFKVLGPKTDEVHQINSANSDMSSDILMLWHERLGHQNIKHVKAILKKRNIDFPNDKDFFYEPCVFGKQHRLPFKITGTSAKSPGNLIHTDTCGPMQETSIGGSRYFVLFKDDYSHYRTVFFIKQMRLKEFWILT